MALWYLFYRDVVTKVSTVLDKMGVVSAKAQNLPVAITSAAKLRNTDHIVYILTDPEGNRFVVPFFSNKCSFAYKAILLMFQFFLILEAMEQLLEY